MYMFHILSIILIEIQLLQLQTNDSKLHKYFPKKFHQYLLYSIHNKNWLYFVILSVYSDTMLKQIVTL